MIKNFFIPEKIGSNYLFPKRVLAFELTKTAAYATQVLFKNSTITIEKFLHETFENGNGASYETKASNAIKKIIEQAGTGDETRLSISSSQIIYKNIRLPFINREKIELVIGYEIEQLLPFSIDKAIIDFLITSENKQDNSSNIIAAAAPRSYIASQLALFNAVGIDPAIITLDMFALFGLYKLLPKYNSLPGGTTLVDIGTYETRIAFIFNSQLRSIRTINKGVSDFAKNVAQELKITPSDALDQIIRFGLDRPDSPTYSQALLGSISSLTQELLFTLTSFSAQSPDMSINRMYILGLGATINGIATPISNSTRIDTHLFDCNELILQPGYNSKNKNSIPYTHIISLATALDTTVMQDVNLRKDDLATDQSKHSNRALLISAALALATLLLLIGTMLWQLHNWRSELYNSNKEVITELQDTFKTDADTTDLETVIDDSRRELQEKEKLWFSLGPSRMSFLKYLLELTTTLDKDMLGLRIEKLTINHDSVILRASVKNFDTLQIMMRDLKKSKLLNDFKPLDETNFTLDIKLPQTMQDE